MPDKLRSNFSKRTLPINPVAPVISTDLPLNEDNTENGALLLAFIGVKYYKRLCQIKDKLEMRTSYVIFLNNISYLKPALSKTGCPCHFGHSANQWRPQECPVPLGAPKGFSKIKEYKILMRFKNT